MKNQYFGDINDYQKYGLLRCLSQAGLKIGLCWMLTQNDSSGDGGRIGYAQNPDRYRDHDPELFSALQAALSTGTRHISLAAQPGILPGALSFSDLLTDQTFQRLDYFSRLFKALKTTDLLFFDPDNGLEVSSTRYGRRGSSKYLYWHEVRQAYDLGFSLLIYQYFPRVQRTQFIQRMIARVRSETWPKQRIYAFQAKWTVTFLAGQSSHASRIPAAVDLIRQRWSGLIHIVEYPGQGPS